MIKRAFNHHFAAPMDESDEELDQKSKNRLRKLAENPNLMYEDWSDESEKESDSDDQEDDENEEKELNDEEYIELKQKQNFHGKHKCGLCPEKVLVS